MALKVKSAPTLTEKFHVWLNDIKLSTEERILQSTYSSIN